MGFIYKPSAKEADAMADITRYLTDRGLPMGLAALYESLAAKAQADFLASPDRFRASIEPYTKHQAFPGREPVIYVPDTEKLNQLMVFEQASGVSVLQQLDYAVELLFEEYEWDADLFLENLKMYAARSSGRRGTDSPAR